VAIAVAAWRVWRARPGPSAALALWGAQLALNALWSFLFFGLEQPELALLDIAVLLAAIVFTTLAFFAVDRVAGWLFVPYLAWVAFASYLNAGVWLLNR
jgi:tryptophan-rich sensory protein